MNINQLNGGYVMILFQKLFIPIVPFFTLGIFPSIQLIFDLDKNVWWFLTIFSPLQIASKLGPPKLYLWLLTLHFGEKWSLMR